MSHRSAQSPTHHLTHSSPTAPPTAPHTAPHAAPHKARATQSHGPNIRTIHKKTRRFTTNHRRVWCRVSEFGRTQGKRRSRMRGFLNLLFHFFYVRFGKSFGNDVFLKIVSDYKPVAVPDYLADKCACCEKLSLNKSRKAEIHDNGISGCRIPSGSAGTAPQSPHFFAACTTVSLHIVVCQSTPARRHLYKYKTSTSHCHCIAVLTEAEM